MTFAKEIEEMAGGPEAITAIVVGPFGWGDDNDKEAYGFDRNASRKPIPQKMKNTVLHWDEVREYLDYNYSSGYGSPECHAVTVYTNDKIIFVDEYDGSTSLVAVPRNPVPHKPSMPGGG